MRSLSVVVSALLAMTASLAAAPTAEAAAAPPPASFGSYVALGDSFASGAGIGIGEYDLAGAPCLRSSKAYAARWAAAHRARPFTFLACSGATTETAMISQVPRIPRDARLVTLTLAGNDTGFGTVLRACAASSPDRICTTAYRAGQAAAVTRAPAGLAATLGLVKLRAPHARVIVLGYPRLFEPGRCDDPAVPDENRRRNLNQGVDVLDAALAKVTRAAGATFVDVRERFAGHGVCAPAGRLWINGPSTGLGAYHPNATGHADGYAQALTAATG